MSEVIRISDSSDLVPTSVYKYAKFPFEKFNPVQSSLINIHEGFSNVAIAASTSAGKTCCAEMYLAYEARKRGGKGIYVGPLKALASEKQQDWTDPDHHFSDLKIAIMTGDFRFTAKRISEVEEADLIVMTPEMLASRCRSHTSEKSKFLHSTGTIVIDESHLLTVPGRGDHIEVAIMKMVEINPDVRIVLLSATMPNVDEICSWISNLTKRDTYYLESTYRPCPLNIHYETYFDGIKSYDGREFEKISTACKIVEDYPCDKFLIFVHGKKTGHHLVDQLSRCGVEAEFHHADLSYKQRRDLEDRFKRDPSLRVIVATSTLAWGLNLPARRVIVCGVHRGIQVVELYDILQMVGRAGRPKYDPIGDAYILVPESAKTEWVKYLRKSPLIQSTLLKFDGDASNPHYKTLAFHIVSEIHYGTIRTKEEFRQWFSRSFAHHQDHDFDDGVVDRTIQMLEDCKAIVVEDGEYKCTAVGKIASMFYYSPFDVADLRRNFRFLFEKNQENDDFAIALALGNIDGFRWGIVSRNEKENMSSFEAKVTKSYGSFFTSSVIKHAFAYFNLLKGKRDIPAFQGLQTSLLNDLDRTMQVIGVIDSMASGWGRIDWFKTLKIRLHYGVAAELAQLCQIPNVGQVRAKRLKDAKIQTLSDFIQWDAKLLAKIMKCSVKLAEEAIEGARMIELKESLI